MRGCCEDLDDILQFLHLVKIVLSNCKGFLRVCEKKQMAA